MEAGQIAYLIEYYISERKVSLIKAVDLIVNHLPHSIRTLVDLDMQLAVFALTVFEDSLRDN